LYDDKKKFLEKLLCGPFRPTFAPTFNSSPGDVAQLVEQRTENPCVGGSIPSITTGQKPSRKRGLFLLVQQWYNILFLWNCIGAFDHSK
jgi:hypothetical protein